MGKEKNETQTAQDAQEVKREAPAFLAQYRMCYPKSKKFHVTSDNMVFLENEYAKATSHQATLGRGELITY